MKRRIRYDNNGSSKIIIIAILVVVIAIGFVGWRLMNRNSLTKTDTTSLGNSACLKVYKDKDICKYTTSFKLTGVAYKTVFTSTQGKAGSSTTMTMLTDTKGNTSISSTSGGVVSNIITLDGTTYTKDPTDGTWWKLAASNASTPATTDPISSVKIDTSATSTTATPATTYKKLGIEACGNATCLKYKVSDTATPGTTQYLWINNKTYQMQRWSTTDSTGASTDAVFTYQAVTITAPTPVRNLKTGI